MTPYEFGDVILVSFPFKDQISAKKRPAVVISSAAYNRSRPDIIIMALSSNLTAPAIPLLSWQSAGLPKATAFKTVVATLEATLVVRRLGALASEDNKALREIIMHVLG